MEYYIIVAQSNTNFAIIGIYMNYNNAKRIAWNEYYRQIHPNYEYVIYKCLVGKQYNINDCTPHYIVSDDEIPW